MSNKLCLYERGHFTEPEISYISCGFSVVIASVGFNIDRVTTQHTPKCAENYSDNKVSTIVLLTPTRFSVNSVITLKTALFVLKRCIQDRDASINNTKILLI